MSWQEMIGHQSNVDRFRKGFQRGRLGSAYLFAGPAGIGKRRFAIKLAQTLFCQNLDPTEFQACGKCKSCQLISKDTHPDLLTVSRRSDSSVVKIEQIIGDKDHRMQVGLQHDIYRKPMLSDRRIAIIDDADHFNQETANTLLKTLEEPPPRALIVLIGTSRQRQLPTILSRCQFIPFQPLSAEQVVRVLQSMDDLQTEIKLEALAAASAGSVAMALTLADPAVFEFRGAWLERLATLDVWNDQGSKFAINFSEAAGKDGSVRRERLHFVGDLTLQFYRALIYKLSGSETDCDAHLASQIAEAAAKWQAPWESLSDSIHRTIEFQAQVSANVGAAHAVEDWLVDLARLADGQRVAAVAW